MNLKIKSNVEEVEAELEGIESRVRDLTPALRVGAAAIDKLVDDTFQQKRDPAGRPWSPYKPSTVKKHKGRVRSLLQNTARLRRSWTARATKSAIVFGTNVPYARFHQEGTKHMKARRMAPAEKVGGRWRLIAVGPAARVLERIRQAISRHVTGGR